MRGISDIIADGGATLERLLREAFDAGMAHGRLEAANDIKARFSGMFDDLTAPYSPEHDREPPSAPIAPTALSEQRAAPGTVKPTIIRMIADGGLFGVTTDELIERTGFKPNSVRGTVSTLQSEGVITKLGDRWHTAGKVLLESAAETNKGATNG